MSNDISLFLPMDITSSSYTILQTLSFPSAFLHTNPSIFFLSIYSLRCSPYFLILLSLNFFPIFPVHYSTLYFLLTPWSNSYAFFFISYSLQLAKKGFSIFSNLPLILSPFFFVQHLSHQFISLLSLLLLLLELEKVCKKRKNVSRMEIFEEMHFYRVIHCDKSNNVKIC